MDRNATLAPHDGKPNDRWVWASFYQFGKLRDLRIIHIRRTKGAT